MRVGSPRADERILLCRVRGAQPWGWHTAGPGVDFWPAVGLLLPPFLPQEVPGAYGPKAGAALPLHGRGAGGAPPGRVLPHLCQMGQGCGALGEPLPSQREEQDTREAAEPLQCPPPSATPGKLLPRQPLSPLQGTRAPSTLVTLPWVLMSQWLLWHHHCPSLCTQCPQFGTGGLVCADMDRGHVWHRIGGSTGTGTAAGDVEST